MMADAITATGEAAYPSVTSSAKACAASGWSMPFGIRHPPRSFRAASERLTFALELGVMAARGVCSVVSILRYFTRVSSA